jgi:folate-binding protein YgfZ
MSKPLQEFQRGMGARFTTLNGVEIVADYGDVPAEHAALRTSAGVLDLSSRSRLCLLGADRARYLHGQVTNDIKKLTPGAGTYAAVTTARGKMESDLNIFCLADELLLDFEPGLTEKITHRLEKFIVADDVQIVDAALHYGLWSVQGPRAAEVLRASGCFGGEAPLPARPFDSVKISDPALGDLYLANLPRLGTAGFDLYVPNASLAAVGGQLIAAAGKTGGRACGWTASETARIEAGLPRFGADMDETNLPLECGLESRAVSYSKGCYIGQEVLNRIHSVGHVTRGLHGLRLADDLPALPAAGDKLFKAGREVGYVTSAIRSPSLNANLALGYVRREACQIGNELTLRTAAGESPAKIVELPFVK